MATLATLAIDLTANSAQMVGELNKANKNIDGFAKSAEVAGRVIKTAFVAATTGMFANMVKESVDAADRMGKLSQRLGASTEALSELQHVADLSGVSFNTMTMGLQRMTRRVSEAANGTGEAKKALEELGMSAQSLNQLAPEKQFEVIADALAGVSNEGDRVRLAMKFFDSEGVALVQTMGDGAEGIRKMREEARRLGLTLSQEDTKAAADFNDELTRMTGRLEGLQRVLGISIVKPLNDLADAIKSVNESSPGVLAEDLDSFSDAVKGIGFAAIASAKAMKGLVVMMWNLNQARLEVYEGLLSFDGDKLGSALDLAKESFSGFKDELNEIKDIYSALYDTEQPAGEAGAATGTGRGGVAILPGTQLEGEDTVDPIERIEESIMLQEEVLQNAYLRQREMLIENLLFEQGEKEKFRKLDEKLTQKYLNDVLKKTWFHNQQVLKWEKLTGKQKYQVAESTWKKLTAGVASGNETISKINKAFAIKDAIVNTYRGVSQSLAAYPMPIAAVFAGMHLAAGLANVQQLRSGGGGGGGGSSINASVPALDTTDTTTDTFGADTEEAPVQKVVTISVEGVDDDALLTKNQLRQVVDQINEEASANVRINI